MKKLLIITSLLFISIFNILFANTRITFDEPSYSKMLYEGDSKMEIQIDEIGRIISIKNNNGNLKLDIKYNDDTSFEIYDSEYKKVDTGNFSINFDNDQFRIDRSYHKTKFSYLYENGIFIVKMGNSIRYFYTYNNTKDYVECFYNQVTENDIDSYDEGYIFSSENIKIIKNKVEKINQVNAQILVYSGFEVLVPFLFKNYEDVETRAKTYSSDSELIEGKTKYMAKNLEKKDGNPWASKNGYGLYDKIIIELPTTQRVKLKIYNGFQSEQKKNLYIENSRAKIIKIKNLNNNIEIVVTLKDTIEEQIVNLQDLCLYQDLYTKLEITILEVYPGKKYKDLCIQAIIPEY